MKLNFGCGEQSLKGFINVDLEINPKSKVNPDLVCDLKKGNLPFESNSFETVHLMHVLEHIEQHHWSQVFTEIHRVLQPNCRFNLAFPEFEICAKYFIENYRGSRDFWRMALYGRQLYPGDYHVVPMRSKEVIYYLQNFGFIEIKSIPEVDEEWNTFITCVKGEKLKTRPELFKKEIFGRN